MAVREGKWKCPSCGGVNRGAHTACEACGTTRDANVKFFLDDDAPVVTDAKQLSDAKSGADWICSRCQNTNRAHMKTCDGCGAPRDEGKVRAHGAVTPNPPAMGQPVPHATPPPLPGTPAAVPAQSSGCGVKILLALIPMLLACCVISWFLTRQHEGVATVASLEWERTIQVQAEKPVTERAWGSAPAGARDVSSSREIRDYKKVQRGTKTVTRMENVQVGTKKVKTGVKDLGNGYFEDVFEDKPVYEKRPVPYEEPVYVDEPIYDLQFTYTIDKWVPERTEVKRGTTDAPAWPPVQLAEKEREGTKTEFYKVTFTIGDKTYPRKTRGVDVFSRFKLGQSHKAKYNALDQIEVYDERGNMIAGLEELKR